MNDDDDLFERVRRANPVPEPTGRRAGPDADALLERVLGQRPRPRRAVTAAVAVLTVVVLATGLTAFVVVRHERAHRRGEAACYARADLDAPAQIVEADDPVTECRALWRAGNFGSPSPPAFAACVLPGRGIGVFPGEATTTCARLGLAVATVGASAIQRAFTDLDGRLEAGCVHANDATDAARGALARAGVNGWTVEMSGEHPVSAAKPCASAALDEQRHVLEIIGVPDLRGGPTTT